MEVDIRTRFGGVYMTSTVYTGYLGPQSPYFDEVADSLVRAYEAHVKVIRLEIEVVKRVVRRRALRRLCYSIEAAILAWAVAWLVIFR